MTRRSVEHTTCLGCGCACDDIVVVVDGDRIAEARNSCALGRAWFADGSVPRETRSGGKAVAPDVALADAAKLLARAQRPLVYLAPDISCETQRAAVAIADRLGALLDSPTGEIAAGILASQRRGRAGATLGEIRQRADLVVFWGVDPADRYPRYASRYAVDPAGLQAPDGRKSRRVVAVDVGPSRGAADADERVAIAPEHEVDALALMRAVVLGRAIGEDAVARVATGLATRMLHARYVALVHDAEPSPHGSPLHADRTEALIALAQALNGPARCALSSLRAGGNRSGADAVATWQTGFPFAVDFAGGYPRYRPHAGAAALRPRRRGGPRAGTRGASHEGAVMSKTRLRIAGGVVYDPANDGGADGGIRDVCIEDGRIVAELPRDAPKLDARGMVVMAGGGGTHSPPPGARGNPRPPPPPREAAAAPAPPPGRPRPGLRGVGALRRGRIRDQDRQPGRGGALEGGRPQRHGAGRRGRLGGRHAAPHPRDAGRRGERARAAAPGAHPLQQPGPGGQRHDDARDDARARGAARPLHPPPVPQLRRRARQELEVGRQGGHRARQRSPGGERGRGPGDVRPGDDAHGRRAGRIPVARQLGETVGQRGRRARNRVRHRPLLVQGAGRGGVAAMGRRARAVPAREGSLAGRALDRPPQRRIISLLPGADPPLDGPEPSGRVPEAGEPKARRGKRARRRAGA